MKAIVLVGPTAVGKTNISFELVDLGFEIISADSVQVYKHLDIGSSKPTVDEREKVLHYCIDIVEPDYSFTAAEYCIFAQEAVQKIHDNEKLPLFVGGTGLYIDAFFQGLSDIPDVDPLVRKELREQLEAIGSKKLHEELCKCDPVFSSKVHINDKQRILRGLEVFRSTGKPLSDFHEKRIKKESEHTKYIGLFLERNILIERIKERTYKMFEANFVQEVKSLRAKGYHSNLQSMNTIGYKEVNSYLNGTGTLQTALDEVVSNTSKYAKRQMTWFRKNKKITWYKPDQVEEIKSDVLQWIHKKDKN